LHAAICIVGYRNPDDILRCLEALQGSTHSDFEVVICENGGLEAFAALTATLPDRLSGGQPVRAMLAAGNLGYAGGVNVCLTQSPEADAWWVLNPDTAPEPQALEVQLERLGCGDCDAVGCTIYLPNGKVQSHGGRWRTWLGRAISIAHSTPLDAPVDPEAIERAQNYLNGASMLVGRRFVERVGPMREDYFLYCEEVEWFLRGARLGMRLGYAPGARVLHYQGTTTGSAGHVAERGRIPVYLGERNKLLLTRDCFPHKLVLVAPAVLGFLLLRYARRGAWAQFGQGLAGWWAGLRGERHAPAWFGLSSGG